MSSHNEQVKPTTFELLDSQPPSHQAPPTGARPAWMLPALLGLLVAALVVVFWLPGRFAAAPPAATDVTDNRADAPTYAPAARTEVPDQASPWSDAQLAKLRKEAQDILAILLDVQFELQEMGVDQWAPVPFAGAKAVATEGDLQYRERAFVEAAVSYQQALTELETLSDSASGVRSEHLELARQAIEDGEQDAAFAALDIAAAIDPAGEALARLTHRAETLEQLLPLLSDAHGREEADDLEAAEALLQQATTLDPAHQRASAELARVNAAHTLQQFNRRMSEGYGALDLGRFAEAKKAFREAAKLSPGSAEARSALRDVDSAETAWRLAKLQSRGQQHEAQEQWQQAVEAFEKALQIDSNLLFAQEGLSRSRGRARLDMQFRTAIDSPDRLSDKAVADAIARVLVQAAAISPRGPVLAAQITQLETLLELANSEILLTLRSDGQTEVTLRKVARLGQFQQRVLPIRPGTYTAVGSRNGYRDVRLTFTISHERVASDIVVICTEEL